MRDRVIHSDDTGTIEITQPPEVITMTKLPISLNTVTPNVPVVVATEAVTQLVQHGVQAYSALPPIQSGDGPAGGNPPNQARGPHSLPPDSGRRSRGTGRNPGADVAVQGVQHTAAQALQNLAESSRTHAQSTDQLIALAGNPALSAAERAEVLALVKQNLNGYATFSQRAEKNYATRRLSVLRVPFPEKEKASFTNRDRKPRRQGTARLTITHSGSLAMILLLHPPIGLVPPLSPAWLDWAVTRCMSSRKKRKGKRDWKYGGSGTHHPRGAAKGREQLQASREKVAFHSLAARHFASVQASSLVPLFLRSRRELAVLRASCPHQGRQRSLLMPR